MRSLYGLTPGDFTVERTGQIVAGGAIGVWDARTGGSRVEDLQALDGSPITYVTSDADGVIGFYGPDGFTGNLWAECGTVERLLIRPVDIATGSGGGAGLPAGNAPNEVLVWTGTAWVPQDGSGFKGDKGDPGRSVEVFEGSDIPLAPAKGDFWLRGQGNG